MERHDYVYVLNPAIPLLIREDLALYNWLRIAPRATIDEKHNMLANYEGHESETNALGLLFTKLISALYAPENATDQSIDPSNNRQHGPLARLWNYNTTPVLLDS